MTTLQLTTLQLTMWCNVYKQTFFLFAREGEKSLHSLSSGMLPKKESNRMTGRRLGVRLLNVQDSIDPRSLLQGRTTNTIAYLAKKKSPSTTARLIGSIPRNHLPSISLECSSHGTWTLASVIRYPNLKTKLSRSLHPSTHLNALPDGIPPQASRIFTPETARLFSQAVRIDSHPDGNQGKRARTISLIISVRKTFTSEEEPLENLFIVTL